MSSSRDRHDADTHEGLTKDAGDNVDGEGTQTFLTLAELLPADSPRTEAEDSEHVRILASVETPLPPILVQRETLRVIDGMHRLQAALIKGAATIEVEFFDGGNDDAFLEAVRRNVSHGKPLTRCEREAAAIRLLRSHYWLSDRSLAEICGVSAKTLGVLRRQNADQLPDLEKRFGRDGKLHPCDGSSGRREAAQILRESPDASTREVARQAGIAQATAADVRARLHRGDSPYTSRARPNRVVRSSSPSVNGRPLDLSVVVDDRALQSTDTGKAFVSWLSDRVVQRDDWSDHVESIPLSRAYVVARVARQCAAAWTEFAEALEERPRRPVRAEPSNN